MGGAAAAEETNMNHDDRFPSRRRVLTAGAFTGLVLALDDAFAQQGLAISLKLKGLLHGIRCYRT
jgi:hypothetical protein